MGKRERESDERERWRERERGRREESQEGGVWGLVGENNSERDRNKCGGVIDGKKGGQKQIKGAGTRLKRR